MADATSATSTRPWAFFTTTAVSGGTRTLTWVSKPTSPHQPKWISLLPSSSERFVRALSPRVAVVSVGRSNRFGHPAPAVLRRYQDVHTEIFRTDRDGAITLDSDGTSLDIRTFTGRALRIDSTTTYHEGAKDTKGTKNTNQTPQDPRNPS